MADGTYSDVLAELDGFLAELNPQTKQAMPADEDMGSKDTTHPSTKVDNQAEHAGTGRQGAETTADVKSDIENGGIDSASGEDAHKEPPAVSMTTATTVGDDPAIETSSTKGDKDDGTTDHPADAEDAATGPKYASWRETFDKMVEEKGQVKAAADLGNSILADLSVALHGDGVKEAAEAGAAKAQELFDAAQKRAQAEVLDEMDYVMEDLVKEAEERGESNADLLYDYYAGLEAAAAEKQASPKNGETTSPTPNKKGQSKNKQDNAHEAAPKGNSRGKDNTPDGEAGGGDSCSHLSKAAEEGMEEEAAPEGESEEGLPGEPGGEGALPPEDLEQLAAAAGGPGGGMDVPGAGGDDMAGIGMEGGEPSDEEVVEALSEALADAGVTPEEFAAAVEGQAAGAEGVPMEAKMAAADVAKTASEKVNQYRNLLALGRIKHTKRASLRLQWAMRQVVKQHTGR